MRKLSGVSVDLSIIPVIRIYILNLCVLVTLSHMSHFMRIERFAKAKSLPLCTVISPKAIQHLLFRIKNANVAQKTVKNLYLIKIACIKQINIFFIILFYQSR